jgi:predicted Zn-dependent protease
VKVGLQTVIKHWKTHDVGAVAQLLDVLSTHPSVPARLDEMVDFARLMPGGTARLV